MKQILKSVLCILLSLCMVLIFASCRDNDNETDVSTTAMQATTTKPYIDSDVSEVLRSFYQDQMPSMVLKSGVKDSDGQEIRCDFSMLQKTLCVDFDSDGVKEIVLLYDISEKAGKRNMDVVVFLDEKDGNPYVTSTQTGSYGAALDGETCILTRYNGQICRVRFINKSSYEAVLLDVFQDGAWGTAITAYKHISNHDKVKLESGTCYIDHAGDGLYQSVTGNGVYNREKYLNYKTPIENYNAFITSLLAETLLP